MVYQTPRTCLWPGWCVLKLYEAYIKKTGFHFCSCFTGYMFSVEFDEEKAPIFLELLKALGNPSFISDKAQRWSL